MKISKTLVAVIGLALFSSGAASAADSSDTECQALYTHSAKEMSFDGTSLVMMGASPTVIFFCDRPVRFAGYLTVASFLDEVSTSSDPFSENPPNAVISIVPDGGDPVDVVVTISESPSVDGDTLTYAAVKILEGDPMPVTGPGVLFIDHMGRPMSPGSVAGVHRRHERREVRQCDAEQDRDGIDCNCGPGLVCN